MELLAKAESILSRNLLALRKASAFRTQERLADAAGLSLRTYQDIERGINWPQKQNLEAIARALGIEESTLFADPDSVRKPSAREAAEILLEYVKAAESAPKPLAVARDPLEAELGKLLAALDESEARALRLAVKSALTPFARQLSLKPRKQGK